MDFNGPRVLGKTGLKVGRLGVAASFDAPAYAFEDAFAHGCNYFYWGSMRKSGMREAMANLCGRGLRDKLVVLIQSYSRSPKLMELFFNRALNDSGLEYADILLLGWHNKKPSPKILEKALQMKEDGHFRFLAVSGHNRSLFPQLASESIFDIFHIRYNAAHRGAEKEVWPKLPQTNRPGIVTYTATRWKDLMNPKKMPPGQPPLSAGDCYRFVLSNPAVDVGMCGPANSAQMHEALEALKKGPLSPAEMQRVRAIGDYVHENAGRFW
jgi:predicted aldo/keto reductase-like oxidoreductase